MDAPAATFMATCTRCGGKFGHPGPCPACCPSNAFHIDTAWQAAVAAHSMQFRRGRAKKGKNGPPYACHVAEIMMMLWRWGFDVDAHGEIYQVACLHDAVEEKGTTYDKIATTSGLGTVLARRTKQMTHEGGDKDAYLATFLDPTLTDVECLIVKIPDRLCNVGNFLVTDRDLPGHVPAKAPYYFAKGEPIFAAMIARRDEIIERAGRASSPFPERCREKGTLIYNRMQETVNQVRQDCERGKMG